MRVPEFDYPRADGKSSPRNPWHSDDYDETDSIFFKAYQVHHRRQVCYFDWDLVTCEAALTMPRLPSDSDYDALQDKLLNDADRILETTGFEQVQLKKLIRSLESTKEVSRRDVLLTTTKRTEINFRSADRKF